MDTSSAAISLAGFSRKALPPVKRQRRSPELKLQVVEETLAPGASVARVARAHGVNANQVFTWRRLYRRGLLLKSGKARTPGLLAVRVAEPSGATSLAVAEGSERALVRAASGKLRRKPAEAGTQPGSTKRRRIGSGMIQIELPQGRLRVTGRVDQAALRVVLEALGE